MNMTKQQYEERMKAMIADVVEEYKMYPEIKRPPVGDYVILRSALLSFPVFMSIEIIGIIILMSYDRVEGWLCYVGWGLSVGLVVLAILRAEPPS